MCSFWMPITHTKLAAHAPHPRSLLHTHTTLPGKGFRQRKREEKKTTPAYFGFFWSSFGLFGFGLGLVVGLVWGGGLVFSLLFSSSLPEPRDFGGTTNDSWLENRSSNFSERRAEGRKSFASGEEEKEQKPNDASAVLNRCPPNCKGLARLCVVAGWEEAGGRGRPPSFPPSFPPSHAGDGRPQPQCEVRA